jgi:Ti-type conjugative transfer relaxase TraA
MIAKGNTHHSGARLASYMLNAKPGERVEMGEVRGFASDNINEAFRAVDAMALGTQCEKPLFHTYVRLVDGERLTSEQWHHVADRIERKLGLSGQPRAITFHVNERSGDAHMHVGWSRIDEETMTARNLAFFKLRLKEVSRELESELGLTPVSNHRQHPEMAPTRDEDQQARRLGVDIHDVRRKIRACWERSDNGQSFTAALASEGLTLAQGERRDFIVIDHEGGMHALGKRITGNTAGEVRARCADLDRESLPTVEQARGQQRTGTRDIHAASLAWEDALAQTAIAKEKIEAQFAEPGQHPLNEYTKHAPALLGVLTKNRATFTRRDIERALETGTEDRTNRAAVAATILNHADVVPLGLRNGPQARYTTTEVLETEQHVLQSAAALARNTRHGISATLRSEKFQTITAEQFRAFADATGPTGFTIIEGQAGTGKSFTMSAIREAYEANGYRVVGLAPTNAVAEGMKDDGFWRARTVHSELFALNNARAQWTARTVVMVDEAAMISTRILSQLTAHANAAGAKLILVGDNRQFGSIERGGMFEVLKDRHGAAELTEVRRQRQTEDRSAAELMAKGKFTDALQLYAQKDAILWSARQSEAADALVAKWARDSAADPSKSRFVFAYTNSDVTELNSALRLVREQRGELGKAESLDTKHGRADFAPGDRIQLTGTDKRQGLFNGQAGTVEEINGTTLTVALDGRTSRKVEFDAATFQDFRHGYAGTIYKGQGRTIDETYLYHSEHWRSASSYVAMTRHSEKAELFVAREIAPDLPELARQMARIDDRRAASSYLNAQEFSGEKPLTPAQLYAWYARVDQVANHAAEHVAEIKAPRAALEFPAAPVQATADRTLDASTADIRRAYRASRDASQFVAALDAQGIRLAVVAAGEAERNGSYRDGEIVAVTSSGQVYQLDERVTGRSSAEVERYLASLDRRALSSVEATQEQINLEALRHMELSRVGALPDCLGMPLQNKKHWRGNAQATPSPNQKVPETPGGLGVNQKPDWRRSLTDPAYRRQSMQRDDEERAPEKVRESPGGRRRGRDRY